MGTAARCVVAISILLAGCAGDAPPAEAVADTGPASVDTLITTASAVLGRVSDLTVGPDGSVYVVDQLSNAVHVLDPAGQLARTFGREGAGPGELNRPSGILFVGDTLAVVETGNLRLQLFTADGTSLLTRPLPGSAGPLAVSPIGRTFAPTLTLDTTLATLRGPDGTERAKVGRMVGTPSRVVQIGASKEQIQRGEVPDTFLNTAYGAWADDGSLWMMVPARATVERFDTTGVRRWELTLEDPSFESVRAEFVSRNAALEGMRLFPLMYILPNPRPAGDELWVLLGQSGQGPAVIQVVNGDGSLGARLEFPEIRDVALFAVDPARGLVYFTTAETAELLRTALPTPR